MPITQEEFNTLMANWIAENGGQYNSAHTGQQIDAAVTAVRNKEATWDVASGEPIVLKPEDITIKSTAHRGFSAQAPENTIVAFELAKKCGFDYVEADVQFTSDGVPVLMHDLTVDRTTGTTLGTLHDLTYDQIKDLDASAEWTGRNQYAVGFSDVKIPTFEEFIIACKRLDLRPYIEINYFSSDTSGYAMTKEQVVSLYNTVKAYGMERAATWISFSLDYLEYIREVAPEARLGYLSHTFDSAAIQKALTLRTSLNEVFLNMSYSQVTSELIAECRANNIPLEVWTVNDSSEITALDPYISGVASDSLIAKEVLKDHYFNCGDDTVWQQFASILDTSVIDVGGNYAYGFSLCRKGNVVYGSLTFTCNLGLAKNTTVVSTASLPEKYIPYKYQSFPGVGYLTRDDGSYELCLIRFGIGAKTDAATSRGRLVISECDAPVGTKIRTSFSYYVEPY